MRYTLLWCLLWTLCVQGWKEPVVELDGVSFRNEIFGDNDYIWVVLFSKGPPTQDLSDTWEKVASKLDGLVKVGFVDISEESSTILADTLKIKTTTMMLFPSTLLVNPDQYRPMIYTGSNTVNAIAGWASRQIPESLVNILTTRENVTKFLSTNGNIPRALLFSQKTNTSPMYKALSLKFIFRLVLGEVRVKGKHRIARDYDITNFPTLVMYSGEGVEVDRYSGSLNSVSEISSWLDQYALPMSAKEEGVKQRDEQLAKEDKERLYKKANPTQRISTSDQWTQVLERNMISVLTFLDPSSSNHKTNLRTMKSVFKKSQKGGTKYNFVWLDYNQQTQIGNSLGIDQSPSIVFLHPTKGWYKNFVGAFTPEAIWNYMSQSLLKGPGQNLKQLTLPAFTEESNEDLFELDPEEEPETKKKDESKQAKKKPKSKPKESNKQSKPDSKATKKKTKQQLEREKKQKEKEEAKKKENKKTAEQSEDAKHKKETKQTKETKEKKQDLKSPAVKEPTDVKAPEEKKAKSDEKSETKPELTEEEKTKKAEEEEKKAKAEAERKKKRDAEKRAREAREWAEKLAKEAEREKYRNRKDEKKIKRQQRKEEIQTEKQYQSIDGEYVEIREL